ncbi:uncharacterized protein [Linepithema humile]|uniref:uncharacterized protein isoform X3 n=1 Tax=Linepithema humile TaxID=83485 RepID=UPI00351EF160
MSTSTLCDAMENNEDAVLPNIADLLEKIGCNNLIPRFEDLSTNDSYLWLSSRNEPWEQVLIHWKNTFQLRQESKATTAFDFIEQWPILKQSNVDTLGLDKNILKIDIEDLESLSESEYIFSIE